MSTPTDACPRCKRANAAHRVACLYCGQAMPNPRPELAPQKRELPANLDELVRLAMSGKANVGHIRAALEQPAPKATATPASPTTPPAAPLLGPAQVHAPLGHGTPAERSAPAFQPPGGASPAPVAAAPALIPNVPIAAPELRAVVDPFDALVEAAQIARYAHRAGDARGVAGALVAVHRALSAADTGRVIDPAAPDAVPHLPTAPAESAHRASLQADEDPPPPTTRGFTLPPIRHPFALVVAGGGTDRAELLATALEVDVATARAIAATAYTRVALRGADQAGLERRAANARTAGLGALVLPRERLQATPPAHTIVRIGPGLAAAAVALDLWETQPNPDEVPRGDEVDLAEVVLAVVGEVEVRDGIAQREQGRWERKHLSAAPGIREARYTVVDLHTPSQVYRLVEGVTQIMDEAGGVARGSGALRSWIQAMPDRFFMPVEPRRVCAVDGTANERRASAWPAWEEHTRLCRLFHGVGGPDE